MHAAQSELDSRKCFHFDGFAIERETLVLPLRQGFCRSFYPDGPPTLQVNFFYFAILPNHDPEITSPSIRVASAFGGYSGSTFASKCSRETVSITCNLDTQTVADHPRTSSETVSMGQRRPGRVGGKDS